LDGVPNVRIEDNPMGGDGVHEKRVMSRHGGARRDRVTFPERGAALEVRNEEGNGAAGEIGHDLFQTLGWMWCLPIVAQEYGNHPRSLSPHHPNDPQKLNI